MPRNNKTETPKAVLFNALNEKIDGYYYDGDDSFIDVEKNKTSDILDVTDFSIEELAVAAALFSLEDADDESLGMEASRIFQYACNQTAITSDTGRLGANEEMNMDDSAFIARVREILVPFALGQRKVPSNFTPPSLEEKQAPRLN